MKKVFAIFLSLLMLTSTVGITLATHYCGGKAVKTALLLGKKDINCGMVAMSNNCESDAQMPVIQRKGCCENSYTQLQVEDNYMASSYANSVVDFQFVHALVSTFFHSTSVETSGAIGYTDYSPPLLNLDIPILVQSFLI